MNSKDYKNFDYQTVLVKTSRFDEVVERYKCFGWEVITSKNNLRYSNILDVEFKRPHKIANKDELQFLQVNMESELNKKGRLEKYKHSKATALGLILGMIAIMCIIGAIICLINLSQIFGIILGCSLIVVGVAVLILEIFLLKHLINIENIKFDTQFKNFEQAVNDYCVKAKLLREVQDE